MASTVGVAQEAPAPLFAEEAPLALTLVADFEALAEDRNDDAPERPGEVWVEEAGGSTVKFEAQLRTRGHYRRDPAHCTMPPLRLDVPASQVDGTPFERQDKLKIVGNCRPGESDWERLVLREYLAYRLLQEVTDESFLVRRARITYRDSSGEREPWTGWAFFIESDESLAERLGAEVFELDPRMQLHPEAFHADAATRVAFFQYLIGNTDWSDVAGHNVALFGQDDRLLPVPYDFDFSGWVDAPYALPARGLGAESVRDRVYMGWCRSEDVVSAVVAEYRAAEAPIRRLIDEFETLDRTVREDLLFWLEPFFDALGADTPAFVGQCWSNDRG